MTKKLSKLYWIKCFKTDHTVGVELQWPTYLSGNAPNNVANKERINIQLNNSHSMLENILKTVVHSGSNTEEVG